MQIKSKAFKNNGNIPKKYTCDGEDINPPLEFVDVPKDAVSLALVADDPDAPSKTWIHWIVWNINPETKEIAENEKLEKAVEGVTDFGKPGYGGPCPPSGSHRYFFRIYALDTKLNLDPSSDINQLQPEIDNHTIAKAELMARYSRS